MSKQEKCSEELATLIKEWTLHGESLTLLSILAFANQKINILVSGPPGQGKSRSTVELAEFLDLPFVKVVSGHITTRGLFETMKSNIDGTIIIDESASELSDNETLTVLRCALFGGKVHWINNTGEDEIEFKGNIILNTNALPKGLDSKAVADRCISTQQNLTPNQVLEKIWHKPFIDAEKAIVPNLRERVKEAIMSVRKKNEPPSENDEHRAAVFLKDNYVDGKWISTLSMRRLKQISEAIKTYNLLTGIDIQDEQLKKMFFTSDIEIKELLKRFSTSETAEYLTEVKGLSRRTAYRRIKETKMGIDNKRFIAARKLKKEKTPEQKKVREILQTISNNQASNY